MSKIKNKFSTVILILGIFTAAALAFSLPSGYVQSRVIYPAVSWVNFNTLHYGTFLGYQTGLFNSGDYNIFTGYQSGYSNTTGSKNSAIGYRALWSNSTGTDNIAIGSEALYSNTTGFSNSAVGKRALFSNTTAWQNSALGQSALLSNTTGYHNSAMGMGALYSNTTGENNSALGMLALYSNSTSSGNSALGNYTLYSNTTGAVNTAMGMGALYSNATGSSNVAIGYSAGYYEKNSNAFYVDNQNRANTASEKAGSLLYGTFNATPASQTLKINAATTIAQSLTVNGTSILATTTVTNITASGQSKARAYATTSASIATSTFTKVLLGTENFDTLGEFDPVTNYRFTAKGAGYYQVNASVLYISVQANASYVVVIYKNGGNVANSYSHSASSNAICASISDIIYLAVNDYLELYTYQTATIAQTLWYGNENTFMSIYKLP